MDKLLRNMGKLILWLGGIALSLYLIMLIVVLLQTLRNIIF